MMYFLAFLGGFLLCFGLMACMPLIGLKLERIQAYMLQKKGLKMLKDRDRILQDIDRIFGELEEERKKVIQSREEIIGDIEKQKVNG